MRIVLLVLLVGNCYLNGRGKTGDHLSFLHYAVLPYVLSQVLQLPCTLEGLHKCQATGGVISLDCKAPTTITLNASLVFQEDIQLDGTGNLVIDGIYFFIVITAC